MKKIYIAGICIFILISAFVIIIMLNDVIYSNEIVKIRRSDKYNLSYSYGVTYNEKSEEINGIDISEFTKAEKNDIYSFIKSLKKVKELGDETKNPGMPPLFTVKSRDCVIVYELWSSNNIVGRITPQKGENKYYMFKTSQQEFSKIHSMLRLERFD